MRIKNGDDPQIKFIADTVRQLKFGQTCYVFTMFQVEKIKDKYLSETNMLLQIEKETASYKVVPEKRFKKYMNY